MMETVTYADFSQTLHLQVADRRLPMSGTLEVTRRCPLTCAHCYNNLPMGDRQAQLSELSYQEYCRILDEISEAGCLWLLFTGGEIFARRDFLDIYTYAKRKGFLITLFTNGTLVTPKIADYLVEWRPFSIEITLYGRTKETYERLTGIPGSYDRCMRGIQLLLERKLPLNLKTVAVTLNRHEIGGMKQFAEEELGVQFKSDGMINPRIDCSQSPLAVRLKPYEIVELDLQDPKRVAEYRRLADEYVAPLEPRDEVYQCGGGLSSFAIDPWGKMSICVLSHVDTFDLRRGGFREAWDGFLRQVRQRKRTVLNKCVRCGLRNVCGMCPANGELESGHPEKPVDFLCHVAHLRGHAFGFPITPHGECEYCEEGTHYQELMTEVAALRGPRGEALAAGQSAWSLPILGQQSSAAAGCSSGGCSACSL